MDTTPDSNDAGPVRVDDFLAHFGVKGMRWGVRKQAKSTGGGPGKPAPKKTESGEMTTAPKRAGGRITEVPKVLPATNDHSRQATNDLTDAQLKRAIERINMEQKYHELTYIPTKKEKAAKFVGDLLKDLLKSELKNISKGKSPLMDMLKEASKTATGDKTPDKTPDAEKVTPIKPTKPPKNKAKNRTTPTVPRIDSAVLETVYDPKTGRFYVPGKR